VNSQSVPSVAAVTIVALPRERFSRTEVSLQALYDHTGPPFELVYVDGHSPRRVRRYLQQQAQAKRFRLIRAPHFMPLSRLRNLGLREVKTPYVVFLENDVIVRPGWLQALQSCAEETGAPVVGPLYLEQAHGREFVHMAGGIARVTEVDGHRRFFEDHRFQGRNLSEVAHTLRREPTEMVEFHCVLIRTDVLRELGGFDEGMKNTADHIDFCLSVREAGYPIYFEPRSVVVFVQPPPFTWSDLRFYYMRWNDTWARQTVAHFSRKWRLDPHDPFLRYKHEWTKRRRRQILDYFFTLGPLPRLRRRLAHRLLTPTVDACIARALARPKT
jgi:GT2 family glycosyltransferase